MDCNRAENVQLTKTYSDNSIYVQADTSWKDDEKDLVQYGGKSRGNSNRCPYKPSKVNLEERQLTASSDRARQEPVKCSLDLNPFYTTLVAAGGWLPCANLKFQHQT